MSALLAKPTSKEELEAFVTQNRKWLPSDVEQTLRSMNPIDQRRVIAAGTMSSVKNPSAVIQARVRKAREMEAQIVRGGPISAGALEGESRIVKPATREELEGFIKANERWLVGEAADILRAMSAVDQRRVMSGGTMSGCRDPVAVIQTRAKKAREMEAELENIAAGRTTTSATGQEPPPPVAPTPVFCEAAAAMHLYAPPEVVTRQASKFAPAACTADEDLNLVGDEKGIGGVVEMLKAKYGCAKGQRLKVIGETGSLLQFEGGKTAPKNHENTGWKWVVRKEESKIAVKVPEPVSEAARASFEVARRAAEAGLPLAAIQALAAQERAKKELAQQREPKAKDCNQEVELNVEGSSSSSSYSSSSSDEASDDEDGEKDGTGSGSSSSSSDSDSEEDGDEAEDASSSSSDSSSEAEQERKEEEIDQEVEVKSKKKQNKGRHKEQTEKEHKLEEKAASNTGDETRHVEKEKKGKREKAKDEAVTETGREEGGRQNREPRRETHRKKEIEKDGEQHLSTSQKMDKERSRSRSREHEKENGKAKEKNIKSDNDKQKDRRTGEKHREKESKPEKQASNERKEEKQKGKQDTETEREHQKDRRRGEEKRKNRDASADDGPRKAASKRCASSPSAGSRRKKPKR